MRTYLIEDLYDNDFEKIRAAFDAAGFKGPIEDIYYLPMPENLLSEEQTAHLNDCGPYFLAVEAVPDISGNMLKMELLVRGRNRLRCSCVAYASSEQRNHMIDYLDAFIKDLDVAV
ncbi:hypothetical protein [Pseudodesulfovibrio tunisiensis]|uniref:hypothetical protein n=1 Tax=Pseudodesulfovibrio tunisiensis TaxID=463192 RepID=UPI001FB40B9F|nr:hypothetical protein [Pseudodesulfovibrio tunisiensis]